MTPEEIAQRIAAIEAAARQAEDASWQHANMSERAGAERERARASALRWALKILREPAPCPRCTGKGLLQNPEDGWQPGLVLTREAEDAVRAVFAGKVPSPVKEKWRICPLCNGSTVRGEK